MLYLGSTKSDRSGISSPHFKFPQLVKENKALNEKASQEAATDGRKESTSADAPANDPPRPLVRADTDRPTSTSIAPSSSLLPSSSSGSSSSTSSSPPPIPSPAVSSVPQVGRAPLSRTSSHTSRSRRPAPSHIRREAFLVPTNDYQVFYLQRLVMIGLGCGGAGQPVVWYLFPTE